MSCPSNRDRPTAETLKHFDQTFIQFMRGEVWPHGNGHALGIAFDHKKGEGRCASCGPICSYITAKTRAPRKIL